MKKKVWRDVTGALINIGEWNFNVQEVPVTEALTREVKSPIPLGDGSYLLDEYGSRILRITEEQYNLETTQSLVLNPLPDGAYEDEADIVEGVNGGLYEASDPRRITG